MVWLSTLLVALFLYAVKLIWFNLLAQISDGEIPQIVLGFANHGHCVLHNVLRHLYLSVYVCI